MSISLEAPVITAKAERPFLALSRPDNGNCSHA